MSARQTEIVKLIASGLNHKQAAAELGLTDRGLEWHLSKMENRNAIVRQLGFADPARLTHYAIANRLVRLGETK